MFIADWSDGRATITSLDQGQAFDRETCKSCGSVSFLLIFQARVRHRSYAAKNRSKR